MNSLALTFNKSALTLRKVIKYQRLKIEHAFMHCVNVSFNNINLAALTLKKGALFSLNNKKGRPNLFASLGIHPIMFVLQSLGVVAFMLGLYAAVITTAALMGVL